MPHQKPAQYSESGQAAMKMHERCLKTSRYNSIISLNNTAANGNRNRWTTYNFPVRFCYKKNLPEHSAATDIFNTRDRFCFSFIPFAAVAVQNISKRLRRMLKPAAALQKTFLVRN